jgi:hypothetical protein
MIRSHELISYLFTYGKLVLPGIGTLKIVRQSARAAHHEFKTGFEIVETTQPELEELKNWLQSLFKLNEADLIKFIADQALQYKRELDQNKYISLPFLGRVFRDESYKLQFEVDKQLSLSLEYAYPDLPLSYFQPEQAEFKTKVSFESDNTVVQKETSIPWYIYLGGVLTAAFLLSLAISYFGGFGPFSQKEIKHSRTDLNEQHLPNPDTSNIFENEDTLQDNISDQSENQVGKVSPEATDKKNSEQITKPRKETNKPVLPSNELTVLLDKSKATRLQLSNPLIIIVGSFKKPAQVFKMIKTLESAGYKSFVSKYDGFYRTGIMIDVTPESSDSLLNEIKANIEKNAWILTE